MDKYISRAHVLLFNASTISTERLDAQRSKTSLLLARISLMQARRRIAGFFALASLLFGGTFVAAKGGLEFFPPLLFVAFRFDIGTAVLLSYVLVTHDRDQWLPNTRADVAGILAAGVFTIGLTNAFIFIGQQYVSSGVGAIINSLNPILTPILAAALLSDETLSRYDWGGLLLGFMGVLLVVGIDPTHIFEGAVVGKAILVLAATSGGVGSVLIRRADSDLSSSVRTAWGLPIAAVLCHLLSSAAGEQLAAVEWTPAGLLALGYVGVFSGAVAFIAYFGLLDEVGAIRSNLIFYVVPVVATIGGWALFGETISALTVAGFGTIFSGFAIIGRKQITAALSGLWSHISHLPTETPEELAEATRAEITWPTQK